MKLITRDSDYAIRALCCIAQQEGKIVSVEQVVQHLQMPRSFLRKILQKLNKSGLLISYRGKGGGFVLAKSSQKIFLTQVMEAFQGNIEIMDHLFKKKKCPNVDICRLKRKIDIIEKDIIKKLKVISVASLL